jgi:hypothetical protein
VSKVNAKDVYRILDANFNRGKEGLRVLEDIARFIWDDPRLTRDYKTIRHQLTECLSQLKYIQLLSARAIEQDVGKRSSKTELKRKGIDDIFYANSQRVKESIRVLEEWSKLINTNTAQDLKRLRYKVYAVEKKASSRL